MDTHTQIYIHQNMHKQRNGVAKPNQYGLNKPCKEFDRERQRETERKGIVASCICMYQKDMWPNEVDSDPIHFHKAKKF